MQCSFVSKIIGVISNWNTSSNWNAFFRSVSVPVRGCGLYYKNRLRHFQKFFIPKGSKFYSGNGLNCEKLSTVHNL